MVEVLLIILILLLDFQVLQELSQLLLFEVVVLNLSMIVHSVAIRLVRMVFLLLLYIYEMFSTQREKAVGSRVDANIFYSLWLRIHRIVGIFIDYLIILFESGYFVERTS